MQRKKETEEQKEKRLAHDEKVRIQSRKVQECELWRQELGKVIVTVS